MLLDETIAAPAVPLNAAAAIGIIRISGAKAADILYSIFTDKNACAVFSKNEPARPRYMHHGFIVDSAERSKFIDEAMVCFFKAPFSYTGEDMVEIFCHGGSYNMYRVLASILKAGARQAEAGEFTKRACINGKIDLCQAEAIADIIASRTETLHGVAISQIKGSLSYEINSIKNILVEILADIEANLDFPEEDIEPLDTRHIESRLVDCLEKASKLLSSYEYGKILKEGLKITIAGCPNVGKSSLFNLLLRENRAIVTAIPGTTRDVITEELNIEGVPFSLADTAGIRESIDVIEKIGIERSYANIEDADICLVMLDSSRAASDEDIKVVSETAHKPRIILVNKIDSRSRAFSLNCLPLKEGDEILEISVTRNDNVEALKTLILKASGLISMNGTYGGQSRNVITNARHAAALANAIGCLNDALETMRSNSPIDLLTIDMRAALSSFGEIVGETSTDDVLHKIFEKFCIGK